MNSSVTCRLVGCVYSRPTECYEPAHNTLRKDPAGVASIVAMCCKKLIRKRLLVLNYRARQGSPG